MTGNGIPGVNEALMQKLWGWGGLVHLVVSLVTCPGPSHFHHVSCMLVKPGCTHWWRKTTSKQTFFCQQTKQFFYINIPGILASGNDSTVGRPRIFSIFSNGKTVHIWGSPIFNCVASFYLHFSKLPVTMLWYSPLGLASLPFSYLKSLINLSLITMPPSKGRIRQDSKTMND